MVGKKFDNDFFEFMSKHLNNIKEGFVEYLLNTLNHMMKK